MPRLTIKDVNETVQELHDIVHGHKTEIDKLRKSRAGAARNKEVDGRLDRIERQLAELVNHIKDAPVTASTDEAERGVEENIRQWSPSMLRTAARSAVEHDLSALHRKIDVELKGINGRLGRQDDQIAVHGNMVREIRNNFVGISKNIRKVVNEQGKNIRRLENSRPWLWSR